MHIQMVWMEGTNPFHYPFHILDRLLNYLCYSLLFRFIRVAFELLCVYIVQCEQGNFGHTHLSYTVPVESANVWREHRYPPQKIPVQCH